MASNKTTKESAEQAATPSAATSPQDSLTPLERLRQKLNAMPPQQQAAVLGRALERIRQKRLKRSSKSEGNG